MAEGLGTALLLAAVVGSGIMGDRLAGGNTAIALLANAIATGAQDVPGFVLAHTVGAATAALFCRWLLPRAMTSQSVGHPTSRGSAPTARLKAAATESLTP